MLDGVILLWFVLAALAVGFVAIDIRNTPDSPLLDGRTVLLDTSRAMGGMSMDGRRKPSPSVPIMTVLSFVALAAGLVLAVMG